MRIRSLFIVILASFSIVESHAQDSQKSKASRPNVLLIVVDDLNDWVGCLGGHPQTKTPNIDRLAARGMLFTNAHCQGTLCNPSRISFLWGRRPSYTGFYSNGYQVKNEPEFLKTHVSLPRHFAAHGYKTLTAGKIFHGGTPEQSQIVGPRLGQWLNGLDQTVHEKPEQWHAIWDFGPQDYEETKFTDHVTATWVAEQLSAKNSDLERAGERKPFFLSVGFYRPHVPFFPPRRVYEGFEEVRLPPIDEDDWSDIPNASWEHVAISTLEQNNHAVRDQRWRYIRYADGTEELYDHETDPNEWKNLAADRPDPRHIAIMRRLKNHLPAINVPQRSN